MLCACGKPLKFKSRNVPRKTCGSGRCMAKLRGPASAETRDKIRRARLEFMKNNPEKTAWRKANMSYPERVFQDALIKHGFHEKYLIVRERSVFPYFIDFAFDDQKIAVEIDGSQHLTDAAVQRRDSEKDSLLFQHGWRVLRLSATLVQTNVDAAIHLLNNFLASSHKSQNCGIMLGVELRVKKQDAKKRQRENQRAQRIKHLESELSTIPSNWRRKQKAARELNVSHTQLNRYLKKIQAR